MNKQLYDPFNDVWNLGDEVGRLFWNLGHHRGEEEKAIDFVPLMDVSENDTSMTIQAELPGLKKEDIKISVRDGILTVSGEKKFAEEKKKENYYRIERRYGAFARSFKLPNTVDPDKINAEMSHGVLLLTIPKKPEAKEKEINVVVH